MSPEIPSLPAENMHISSHIFFLPYLYMHVCGAHTPPTSFHHLLHYLSWTTKSIALNLLACLTEVLWYLKFTSTRCSGDACVCSWELNLFYWTVSCEARTSFLLLFWHNYCYKLLDSVLRIEYYDTVWFEQSQYKHSHHLHVLLFLSFE
jgi:hypothetical protein